MTRHLVPAAIIALAGTPALAQNALGDGRALDANLQAGSGGRNNAVRNYDQVLRFQNGIVTGNAPGGFAFRGDVGYVNTGEFTGGVGIPGGFGGIAGNTEYNFRRESLFSGVAGRGLRGTEALQYQFQMLTGSNNRTNLTGALELPRPYAIPNPSEYLERREADIEFTPTRLKPGENPDAIRERDLADPGFDDRGDMLWDLRSISSMTSNDALKSQVIDTRFDEQGNRYNVTSDTLSGIKLVPLNNATPKTDGPKTPTFPGLTPAPNEDEQRSPMNRPTIEGARTYEDILDDIRTGVSPLQAQLAAEEQDAEEDAGEGVLATEIPTPAWQQRLIELRRSLGVDPTTQRITRPGEQSDESGAVLENEETIDLLKRAGGRIDVLSPPGVGGIDPYTMNMNRAEELLAAGEYFNAEERFARALAARPGDPMAGVGRIHAELGAGMYLSALLNLRSLLASNPEIIGATYASNLLPDPEKLKERKADLRTRLATDSGLPGEAAILLAYLGYQTGDARAIAEGLDKADAVAREKEDERFARLVELMRDVWTETKPDQDD